jgi:hypothetical protein
MNMQDRSINIGGNLQGTANTGDNSVIQNNWGNSSEGSVADDLLNLLRELSQKYPHASELQKETVLQVEIQQITQQPDIRQRFLSATKAGSIELVKVLTNNPFVSVPIETFKGWLEA